MRCTRQVDYLYYYLHLSLFRFNSRQSLTLCVFSEVGVAFDVLWSYNKIIALPIIRLLFFTLVDDLIINDTNKKY